MPHCDSSYWNILNCRNPLVGEKQIFLLCGYRIQDRLLNLSFQNNRKPLYNLFSLHSPSESSEDITHSFSSLLGIQSSAETAFSKGIKLISSYSILLGSVDLELPHFIQGSETLCPLYKICFKFSPQGLQQISSPTGQQITVIDFREADDQGDRGRQIVQIMFLHNLLSSFIIVVVAVIFNWLQVTTLCLPQILLYRL